MTESPIDVLALISASLGVDRATLSPDSDSDSVSGWDSLAQVDLVADLERVIGDRLHPKEVARMTSVRSVVRVLESREIALVPFA